MPTSHRAGGDLLGRDGSTPWTRTASGINEMNTERSLEDVRSIDALVQALYACVSFPPGGQPDYGRLRSLFHPEARISPPRSGPLSPIGVLDIENFITGSREFIVTSGLDARGFSEREIGRNEKRYGNIAQVFSAYESRHLPADPKPHQRGVNAIQLVRDRERWWVMSIVWDLERADNPVPPELKQGG